MASRYRLSVGATGPLQQSPVSCGSACLTVARMLVDPVFAAWVQTGQPRLPGTPPGATQQERFAAYERLVMRRTNRLRWSGGRLNAPWPHVLGTPPWGARHELENGAATEGTRYAIALLRLGGHDALVTAYDRVVAVVTDGEPALLYVGDDQLPRHVVLVLPGAGDRILDVYDPAMGVVRVLRRDEFVERHVRLAGWDMPWMVVRPTGERRERAADYASGMDPAPA